MTARERLIKWREDRQNSERDLKEVNAELPPLIEAALEEELKITEIAELVGLSRNSVYAHIQKGELS